MGVSARWREASTRVASSPTGTKGGSSGSPVLNMCGEAVGLNAGGKNKAASAYYLPLHRVVRALRLLQECHQPDGTWRQPTISRGDLQTTFVFKGFDEVRAGVLAAGGHHRAQRVTALGWVRRLAGAAPGVAAGHRDRGASDEEGERDRE